MKQGLVLIGGGGHCKAVLESLDKSAYAKIAVCDAAPRAGADVLGVPIAGGDDGLPRLFAEGYTCAFLAIGGVGQRKARERLYQKLAQIGFSFPCIVDESAAVSAHARIGEGTFIGKRAVVGAGVTAGCGCILNTGCIVEHDCTVGAFTHLAPGAVLCGGVKAGARVHIGANAVVIEQRRIGDDACVGAGSTVVRDIPPRATAYGNPCRIHREEC